MKSRTADAVERDRNTRIAAMSPLERLELAERLGREGLASYMTLHALEPAVAIARIKATRRLGRPRSRCAEAR